MDGTSQAVEVLLLVVFVAPVAVYFLLLGLVNSHARPCLVSSRGDFVALTCVMVPLLVAPALALGRAGLWWLVGVEAAVVAWVFHALLPRRDAGWVIYNIGAGPCREIVEDCLRRLGWRGRWRGPTWVGEGGRIHLSSLSVLRNVTVHLDLDGGPQRPERVAALGAALEDRLAQVEQLPSTAGACMLLLGVGLLSLPVWMMGRHIQDLVEAMIHLFG